MKKPSKRLREEAAMICAIAASWPNPISVTSVSERLCGEGLNDAARLAVRAWNAANCCHVLAGLCTVSPDGLRDVYAEAEAMLRSGGWP